MHRSVRRGAPGRSTKAPCADQSRPAPVRVARAATRRPGLGGFAGTATCQNSVSTCPTSDIVVENPGTLLCAAALVEPCVQLADCNSCLDNGCLWCSSPPACIRGDIYLGRFPFGQCHTYFEGDGTCNGPCHGVRTVERVAEAGCSGTKAWRRRMDGASHGGPRGGRGRGRACARGIACRQRIATMPPSGAPRTRRVQSVPCSLCVAGAPRATTARPGPACTARGRAR